MRDLKVIGHRGAKGHEPENTLRSFEAAIAMGCEWIEFDVRVLDKMPIIIHDDTVDRTSNGQGEIAKLGLFKARTLDFGKGEKLPLLSEVFTKLSGRCGLQIEIKGADGEKEICEEVSRQLRAGFSADDVLISAFDHRLLARVKALLPGIRTGALTYGIPHDLAACAKALGCYSLHLSREYVTSEYITDIKRLGLKALVYTVNDRSEADHLAAMGIDGVFSDYPDRLFKVQTP
jgi:glycerophosphoryl diester phosphodiesterase